MIPRPLPKGPAHVAAENRARTRYVALAEATGSALEVPSLWDPLSL